jgi:NAD kinase
MGKDVIMKKDLELMPTDINDRDLLISLGRCHFRFAFSRREILSNFIILGGDGTYLRTSGAIETPDLPILGINTDPSRSTGHLCNQKIYNDKKEKQIENIFDQLEKENFEYFYRQRINFQMESPVTGEKINKLVLNEIFVAE